MLDCARKSAARLPHGIDAGIRRMTVAVTLASTRDREIWPQDIQQLTIDRDLRAVMSKLKDIDIPHFLCKLVLLIELGITC